MASSQLRSQRVLDRLVGKPAEETASAQQRYSGELFVDYLDAVAQGSVTASWALDAAGWLLVMPPYPAALTLIAEALRDSGAIATHAQLAVTLCQVMDAASGLGTDGGPPAPPDGNVGIVESIAKDVSGITSLRSAMDRALREALVAACEVKEPTLLHSLTTFIAEFYNAGGFASPAQFPLFIRYMLSMDGAGAGQLNAPAPHIIRGVATMLKTSGRTADSRLRRPMDPVFDLLAMLSRSPTLDSDLSAELKELGMMRRKKWATEDEVEYLIHKGLELELGDMDVAAKYQELLDCEKETAEKEAAFRSQTLEMQAETIIKARARKEVEKRSSKRTTLRSIRVQDEQLRERALSQDLRTMSFQNSEYGADSIGGSHKDSVESADSLPEQFEAFDDPVTAETNEAGLAEATIAVPNASVTDPGDDSDQSNESEMHVQTEVKADLKPDTPSVPVATRESAKDETPAQELELSKVKEDEAAGKVEIPAKVETLTFHAVHKAPTVDAKQLSPRMVENDVVEEGGDVEFSAAGDESRPAGHRSRSRGSSAGRAIKGMLRRLSRSLSWGRRRSKSKGRDSDASGEASDASQKRSKKKRRSWLRRKTSRSRSPVKAASSPAETERRVSTVRAKPVDVPAVPSVSAGSNGSDHSVEADPVEDSDSADSTGSESEVAVDPIVTVPAPVVDEHGWEDGDGDESDSDPENIDEAYADPVWQSYAEQGRESGGFISSLRKLVKGGGDDTRAFVEDDDEPMEFDPAALHPGRKKKKRPTAAAPTPAPGPDTPVESDAKDEAGDAAKSEDGKKKGGKGKNGKGGKKGKGKDKGKDKKRRETEHRRETVTSQKTEQSHVSDVTAGTVKTAGTTGTATTDITTGTNASMRAQRPNPNSRSTGSDEVDHVSNDELHLVPVRMEDPLDSSAEIPPVGAEAVMAMPPRRSLTSTVPEGRRSPSPARSVYSTVPESVQAVEAARIRRSSVGSRHSGTNYPRQDPREHRRTKETQAEPPRRSWRNEADRMGPGRMRSQVLDDDTSVTFSVNESRVRPGSGRRLPRSGSNSSLSGSERYDRSDRSDTWSGGARSARRGHQRSASSASSGGSRGYARDARDREYGHRRTGSGSSHRSSGGDDWDRRTVDTRRTRRTTTSKFGSRSNRQRTADERPHSQAVPVQAQPMVAAPGYYAPQGAMMPAGYAGAAYPAATPYMQPGSMVYSYPTQPGYVQQVAPRDTRDTRSSGSRRSGGSRRSRGSRGSRRDEYY